MGGGSGDIEEDRGVAEVSSGGDENDNTKARQSITTGSVEIFISLNHNHPHSITILIYQKYKNRQK